MVDDRCRRGFFLHGEGRVFGCLGLLGGRLFFRFVEVPGLALGAVFLFHDLRQDGNGRFARFQRVAVQQAFGDHIAVLGIDDLEGDIFHQVRGGGGGGNGDGQADDLHHRQRPVSVAVDFALRTRYLARQARNPDLELAFICPFGDQVGEIQIEDRFVQRFLATGNIIHEIEFRADHVCRARAAGPVTEGGVLFRRSVVHDRLEVEPDDHIFVVAVATADEILKADHQIALIVYAADAVFQVVAMHVGAGAVEYFAGLAFDGGCAAVVMHENECRTGGVDRRRIAVGVLKLEMTVRHLAEIVLFVAVRDHEHADTCAGIHIEADLAFAADKIAAGTVQRCVFPGHFDPLDNAVRVDRVVTDGALIARAFALECHRDGLCA